MRAFESRTSLTLKVLFIGFLALALLIPLEMVRALVRERAARRDEAVAEVSSTWGAPQDVQGPVLVVPYRRTIVERRNEVGVVQGVEVRRTAVENAFFLPDELHIRGQLDPQSRSRGLYEVILYDLEGLELSGSFHRPDFDRLGIAAADVLWDQAFVVVGISDTRALPSDIEMSWGSAKIAFTPGLRGADLFPSGIHAVVAALDHAGPDRIPFGCKLDLRGSSTVRFAPLAAQTTVELSSAWPNPSFLGSFLPVRHEVTERGFTARWKVSYFGSGLPQQFLRGGMPDQAVLDKSLFGVKLYVPVDFYQENERAVKYGFLFITLTFVVFFMFELFSPLSLHPFQYLLVGLALCLFYLLFLSLSEQVGFVAAYTLASIGVIALISGYCVAVLGTRRHALSVLGLLVALYGFLFVLLVNDAYALLLGSLGLFAILATIMYLTRHIDWYAIRLGVPTSELDARGTA